MAVIGTELARLERIDLSDEVFCSSRVIFAMVKLGDGTIEHVQMIKVSHPELEEDFDTVWAKVEKSPRKCIGSKVKLVRYDSGYKAIQMGD